MKSDSIEFRIWCACVCVYVYFRGMLYIYFPGYQSIDAEYNSVEFGEFFVREKPNITFLCF